jgi:RNA polymerase sigma-70 factor, ECF subfamily
MQLKGPNNEAFLIKKYSETGDLKYLGELYSAYMHLVYGLALKYLENRDEAKDAVMQIFEKLITDINKQEIREFKPWLYVLSKNYCLMQLRSSQSRAKREKIYSEKQVYFMESEDAMHPIDKEDAILDAALMDCIQNLNNEQKQCIEYFYFNNRCYQEIADLLNIEEKKVKSYLQNGKRNLKICLEGKNVR